MSAGGLPCPTRVRDGELVRPLLAGCHGVLRHHRIDWLAAYRSATGEQLACLHRFGPTIRRLVARGDPDLMSALWPPRDITWMVAGITGDPTTRLLSAKR